MWHRLAAAAAIQPLAWELPYDLGVALKKKKKKVSCQTYFKNQEENGLIHIFAQIFIIAVAPGSLRFLLSEETSCNSSFRAVCCGLLARNSP